MIPIPRKELYLNKIVGNDDYDIPEKPIIEEEFFFAEILGEAVQAPEPLPRYQIYLAKIAGRNIEIPYPETRLEYFLAKAAGMDIETPTPITREEIFWSNYSAIVEFEIEGVPPLTYKAIEGTLENYRIYGNTVGGESVGDRTGNLWGINGTVAFSNDVSVKSKGSEFIIQSSGINGTVSAKSPQYQNKFKLHLTAGTYTYSYRYNGTSGGIVMGVYTIEDEELNSNFTLLNDTDIYIGFYIPPHTTCNQRRMFMLNSGSAPLPYEPYGYKVPVTVSNGTDTLTTTIYLDAPLEKSGNNADYIGYATQKRYNADGTSQSVELPTLQTVEGTNTLSIGTTVQPSKVYIKSEKGRE